MPAGAPGHDPNTLVLHKLVEMFVIARSNNMGGMAIVPCIREALAAIAQSCEIDTLLLSVEDEVAFNRDRPVLSALHRAIQSPDTELPLMAEDILSPLLSRQPLFAPGQYADAAAAVIMIHLALVHVEPAGRQDTSNTERLRLSRQRGRAKVGPAGLAMTQDDVSLFTVALRDYHRKKTGGPMAAQAVRGPTGVIGGRRRRTGPKRR
jgi:hypothetical protein